MREGPSVPDGDGVGLYQKRMRAHPASHCRSRSRSYDYGANTDLPDGHGVLHDAKGVRTGAGASADEVTRKT